MIAYRLQGRLGKRYQVIIYHKQHGYHNKKARLMPRSFLESEWFNLALDMAT